MKLNITTIEGEITEDELSSLIYKAFHQVDARGDLTDIVMTAAQRDAIQHFPIYHVKETSAEIVVDKIVGSLDIKDSPSIYGINVEVV